MEAVVHQETLLWALGAVRRAVSKGFGGSEGIELSADGHLKAAAWNGEVYIEARMTGQVMGEGRAVVLPRTFSDLIAALEPEEVSLVLEGALLGVGCARNRAHVRLLDDQSFEPPYAEATEVSRMEATALKQVLNGGAYAVSKDGGREVLSGVYLELEDDTITVTSADGYRLAMTSGKLGEAVAEPVRILVPALAVQELANLCKDGEVSVALDSGKKHVFFQVGDATIGSGLFEKQVPDYRQVIPQDTTVKATLDRAGLLIACKTAKAMGNTAGVVTLVLGEGKVIIVGDSAGQGDAGTEIAADVEGEEEVAMNGRYLTDAVQAVPTEKVLIEKAAGLTAVAIRPVGEGVDVVGALMPMRLG
jgi:DNA polymerase-3 subunit beta